MNEWTTTKLLDWMIDYLKKAGVDNARLKAEMLLSHILGVERIQLYIARAVDDGKLSELKVAVRQAASDKPVEYIIGKTTFYSIELAVGPGCLIPRPETEDLVQKAVDFLRSKERPTTILDVCCGSGCIPVAIAKNVKNCKITASDISTEALDIAATNIATHNLSDRLLLVQSDMFESIDKSEKYDLITCNPPYISAEQYEGLDKNVKDYEPKLALFADDDGLSYYKVISEKAKAYLKDDSLMLLEIGFDQGEKVAQIFEKSGYKTEILKDFTGNPRIALITL